MFRCGYLAWWLSIELKRLEIVERCEDGPWCGCDQHRLADNVDDEGDYLPS